MDLALLGWNETFVRAFSPYAARGLVPGRVALEHKHAYVLFAEAGEVTAEVLGRLLKRDTARPLLPVVGDWVAAELRGAGARARIHAVLPRHTAFSRRAPGDREEEQVLAANLDTVFLMCGLDADYNPRRIERYLTLARGSGAAPVVVLNKADLCAEAEARREEIGRLAAGVPVVVISAEAGTGLEGIEPFLGCGRTVALLGSSGVGKSTLVNRLLGHRRQAVGSVRSHDQRGRHTTARRELIALPGGALLIDTPGMRELQLWDTSGEGLVSAFPEIAALAAGCRFRDCRHEGEPGCAVQDALVKGLLPPARLASFRKLRMELEGRLARVAGTTAETRPTVRRVKGRRIMRG